MKRHLAALSSAFILAALAHGSSRGISRAASAADCEGDTCSQVTVTYDDAKQQYQAQNNSTDRWVRVSASNFAAATSVCLGPGKSDYL